ncbi:MAG: hypothetical protein ACLPKB_24500 [Xanthobacteraceae bacterium]
MSGYPGYAMLQGITSFWAWIKRASAPRLFGAAAISSALVPGLANVAWKIGGDLYDWGRLHLLIKTPTITMLVSPQFVEKLGKIADFHCLIIRYGVDDMFKAAAQASDKDKVDGQRQFSIINVDLDTKRSRFLFKLRSQLVFKLPIHPYLGTQFKLYATPKRKGGTIMDVESALREISSNIECPAKFDLNTDPKSPATSLCVERGGSQMDKVYFLVDKFWFARAAGDITNNYVPPT